MRLTIKTNQDLEQAQQNNLSPDTSVWTARESNRRSDPLPQPTFQYSKRAAAKCSLRPIMYPDPFFLIKQASWVDIGTKLPCDTYPREREDGGT
eukprot:CAMPEP_0116859124 /NCGR_PEP_ID=MMETSP0418-20121206/21605_1 /TAXON_ID=1158023 /ORGANISM="Astrosyne radiata, Strain 13vi08-1A" /LENGTH=93 /DNA_ID=CAMNT_0004493225 /DNA_START=274 /DNA_END=550 /DNA_ORIENTATION=-